MHARGVSGCYSQALGLSSHGVRTYIGKVHVTLLQLALQVVDTIGEHRHGLREVVLLVKLVHHAVLAIQLLGMRVQPLGCAPPRVVLVRRLAQLCTQRAQGLVQMFVLLAGSIQLLPCVHQISPWVKLTHADVQPRLVALVPHT